MVKIPEKKIIYFGPLTATIWPGSYMIVIELREGYKLPRKRDTFYRKLGRVIEKLETLLPDFQIIDNSEKGESNQQ